MFERFTTRARHVVVLSQEEARKFHHNYIGTEHILLGLLGEPDGLACHALAGLGMSLEDARQEVEDLVGSSKAKKAPSGHIPFTPRAKKTLEYGLREALELHHEYIGTEHILLGLIREGETGEDEGHAVKVLKRHAELPAIRAAVLALLATEPVERVFERRWLRRTVRATSATATEFGSSSAPGADQPALNATPAADATLSEAARIAGAQPVGSHHLLLASLADPGTAAARALAALGVDLDRAKEALRGMDVAGTSDELPEDAGRRQMVIHVTEDRLTLEATDPVLVLAGIEAIAALGDREKESGKIYGSLPVSASLSQVWQALLDSLKDIQRRAASSAGSSVGPTAGPPAQAAGPPAPAADEAGEAGAPGTAGSGAV
jgi:ATP-dependent Clp protease ATP-binding subunit ClpA